MLHLRKISKQIKTRKKKEKLGFKKIKYIIFLKKQKKQKITCQTHETQRLTAQSILKLENNLKH